MTRPSLASSREGTADIVVALMTCALFPTPHAGLYEVGVEVPLREDASGNPEPSHRLLLDLHEHVPDDVALLLGLGDATERAQKLSLGVHASMWRAPSRERLRMTSSFSAFRMRPVSLYRKNTCSDLQF
jgi:hypothetical protein